MKVNYCQECGNKLVKEAVFCSECGAKIIQEEEVVVIPINHCTSCDYSTKEDDAFCPECGAQMSQVVEAVSVSDDVPFQSEDLQKTKQTSERINKPRKSRAKSTQKSTRKKRGEKQLTSAKKTPVKKKGGFLRVVGKVVLGFILFLIIGSVVLYNIEKNEWEKSQRGDDYREIPSTYGNEKTDETTTKKKTTPKSYETKAIPNGGKTKMDEPQSIKQVANHVEKIFQNADTTALKQVLTKTSLATYDGVFSSIEPYMDEYGKAFKNRRLEIQTNLYSLYSFKDQKGNRYTVEFTQVDDGVWKLVRF